MLYIHEFFRITQYQNQFQGFWVSWYVPSEAYAPEYKVGCVHTCVRILVCVCVVIQLPLHINVILNWMPWLYFSTTSLPLRSSMEFLQSETGKRSESNITIPQYRHTKHLEMNWARVCNDFGMQPMRVPFQNWFVFKKTSCIIHFKCMSMTSHFAI